MPPRVHRDLQAHSEALFYLPNWSVLERKRGWGVGGAGYPCPPGVGLHQLPMRGNQIGTTPGEGGLTAGALKCALIHSLTQQTATELPPLIRHRGFPARGRNRRNKTTAKVICAARKKQET